MTSMDKNGVTVSGFGKQAQSQRSSAPSIGISKVGRDAREKVFITETHIKPNRLGRESPIRDTINLPSTLNPQPQIKFGTSKRPDLSAIFGGKAEDAADIPTNDALDVIPDSQMFKYPRAGEIIIGTDPIGKLNTAELMINHSAAFYARDSPGPAAIGDKFGPDFKATKKRIGFARPFGIKTKLKPDWQEITCLPAEVGPGMYPIRDVSIGQQHLTQRRNQPVHAIGRGPKFAKVRSEGSVISTIDADRSSFGRQALGKNRTEPTINFNCDTRKSRDRSQICRTKLDQGPSAFMPKFTAHIPYLPPERHVLASGMG
jgi:hypothetical protein